MGVFSDLEMYQQLFKPKLNDMHVKSKELETCGFNNTIYKHLYCEYLLFKIVVAIVESDKRCFAF